MGSTQSTTHQVPKHVYRSAYESTHRSTPSAPQRHDATMQHERHFAPDMSNRTDIGCKSTVLDPRKVYDSNGVPQNNEYHSREHPSSNSIGSTQSTTHQVPKHVYRSACESTHRSTLSAPQRHDATMQHERHFAPDMSNRTDIGCKSTVLDPRKVYDSNGVPQNNEYHSREHPSSNSIGSTQSTTHQVPKHVYRSACESTHRSTLSAPQRHDATMQHERHFAPDMSNRTDIGCKSTVLDPRKVYDSNGVPQNNEYHSREHPSSNSIANNNVNKQKKCDIPIGNTKDKAKNNLKSIIKPPNKIKDLDDFLTNWNIWKEQLISFLTLTDESKKKYHNWGNFLLYFMGPVGQQILDSLFFDKDDYKKDYEILIQKYDSFYKFNTAVKSGGESIDKYIERLKGQAAQNIRNVDEILKEKIAKDIQKLYKERFIALANSKLPHFKFETTFKFLSLAEITFLWEICEKSNFEKNQNCICCGKFHEKNKCPAWNKECNKCKRKNHYAKYCPGPRYINNCNFCGGNHACRQCPAYGEACSKCGKMNHFSWQCSSQMLLKNCRFCGFSHMMDRDKCPAKSSLCTICRNYGHYEVKCPEKLNTVK